MPQALLYAFPPFSLLHLATSLAPSVWTWWTTEGARLVLVAPHALSNPAPPGWIPQFEGSSVPGEQVTAPSLPWGGAADGLAPERERLHALGLPGMAPSPSSGVLGTPRQ